MGAQPGGRFVMVNGTAQTLISFAYNVRLDELIVGAPEWTRAETYDVNAKAPNPAPSLDQLRLMVRTLLRERFNLRATQTQEERPIYRLVLARADGRLGLKLHKAEIDCDVLRAHIAAGKAPPLRPPPATGAVTPCTTRSRPASMESGGTTMAALATMLTGMVRRPVTDNTGLKGYFTYEIEYEPIGFDEPHGEPSKLPSIFTALQEQLGLRLDAARAPVDVLVIDRIERPTPD